MISFHNKPSASLLFLPLSALSTQRRRIMLRLLNRNPSLRQITHKQPPFPLLNPTINGAAASNQNGSSPFTAFYFFFSSAASNLRNESAQIEQPILDFFHSYGFNDAQIKKCVYKCPSVRSTGTIKPKFEHLLAFGFSPSELVMLINFEPNLLATSLKKRIEPNLSLLEATFGSKSNVIKGITHGPWLLARKLEKHVIPNLKILKENNIPTDKINLLVRRYPRILYKHPDIIVEAINKLKGLGMCLSNLAFIHAMSVMCGLKKETWERKMELYRSFGWSEKDTLLAIASHPMCMGISDEKIKKKMKFFKEKLGWDSAMVLRWSVVLSYSLDGRIIPRCAVLSVLAKKGLWNGKPKLYVLFNMAERDFKVRFVETYEKELPDVIDAYQGKIAFVGFESMEGKCDKS